MLICEKFLASVAREGHLYILHKVFISYVFNRASIILSFLVNPLKGISQLKSFTTLRIFVRFSLAILSLSLLFAQCIGSRCEIGVSDSLSNRVDDFLNFLFCNAH